MICLRCGYCCIEYDVIIVEPSSVADAVDFDNPKNFKYKPSKEVCPFLSWTGLNFECLIHNYPWYELTPCYAFTQIEANASVCCRLGDHIVSKYGINYFKDKYFL